MFTSITVIIVLLSSCLLIHPCKSQAACEVGGNQEGVVDQYMYTAVGIGVSPDDIMKQKHQADISDFDVQFYLFTSDNPNDPQILEYNNPESIDNSNFNSDNPTRFIVHGWLSDNTSAVNIKIREAYMGRSENNFNVIVYDWGAAAMNINYVLVSFQTEYAGRKLAKFINFLIVHAGLDIDRTYLIGHSLGAHVSGYAGKNFQRNKINTIFGLDPAKPLFAYAERDLRLSIGDAHYVETIHSDGGILGQRKPIGNASFYPAWGILQPGCSDITTSCSHARSYLYFAESIMAPNKFFARQCRQYNNIVDLICKYTCQTAYMGGEPSNIGNMVNGVYYLPVNPQSPFMVGKFN